MFGGTYRAAATDALHGSTYDNRIADFALVRRFAMLTNTIQARSFSGHNFAHLRLLPVLSEISKDYGKLRDGFHSDHRPGLGHV